MALPTWALALNECGVWRWYWRVATNGRLVFVFPTEQYCTAFSSLYVYILSFAVPDTKSLLLGIASSCLRHEIPLQRQEASSELRHKSCKQYAGSFTSRDFTSLDFASTFWFSFMSSHGLFLSPVSPLFFHVQLYPPQDWLAGPMLPRKFDSEVIAKAINELSVHNVRYARSSFCIWLTLENWLMNACAWKVLPFLETDEFGDHLTEQDILAFKAVSRRCNRSRALVWHQLHGWEDRREVDQGKVSLQYSLRALIIWLVFFNRDLPPMAESDVVGLGW